MKNLNLVNQIVRDVEAANSRRETNITWKNWNVDDILEPYNVRSLKVKNIIRRAVKRGLSPYLIIYRFKLFFGLLPFFVNKLS